MTEAEWLACDSPRVLLKHLGRQFSDRKLRLFACACCRRVWRYASDKRLAGIIDAIEQYANGEAAERDRLTAQKAAIAVGRGTDLPQNCIAGELLSAAQKTVLWKEPYPGELAYAAVGWGSNSHDLMEGERAAQGVIVKEMFGNPFRPVIFSHSWHTETAVALARQMYESRDFGAMPILGDALQDAGCDNAEVLGHCRGSGPHVRGCWVVDLVLGKE